MGDRVIVQIGNNLEFGPVLYSHYCGHKMPEIVRKWATRMRERKNDISYLSARMLQEMIGDDDGDRGYGTFNASALQTADDTHGDAGVIVVDPTTFRCTCSGGYLVTGEDGFPALEPE